MSSDRIERVSIHESVKGSLGQNEDWYTLLIDKKTGQKSVEHEWSHVNPYKPNKNPPGASGSRTVPLDEFMNSPDANLTVKSKLQDMLKVRT